MKHTKKAESLVWIIVGVTILSIVLLWVWNLIYFSHNTLYSFTDAQKLDILKNNITNVVRSINTNNIQENEIFYVYKNQATNTFQIFTGSTNTNYKYLDEFGNNVDPATFLGDVYAQTLLKQRNDTSLAFWNQVIKVTIRKLIKK